MNPVVLISGMTNLKTTSLELPRSFELNMLQENYGPLPTLPTTAKMASLNLSLQKNRAFLYVLSFIILISTEIF